VTVAGLRERVRALRGRRLQKRLALPRLLRAFADVHPAATFVEIGANDGEQHDHLREHIRARQWRGVMVEPVPYVFERLRHNYAGIDRVALENAAIGERDGQLPFYHLVDAAPEERAQLPDWYDGIGSFSRDFLVAHGKHMPDIEERIVRAEVPALTYESLCRKHGFDHVDLLVVDTEGYDWELLRHVDFARDRPQLVIYEHFHLSEADLDACEAHLRGLGYQTMQEGFDTFCLDPGADPRLQRVWGDLRPAVPGVTVRDE
jgi:FkbM family methyltransferase